MRIFDLYRLKNLYLYLKMSVYSFLCLLITSPAMVFAEGDGSGGGNMGGDFDGYSIFGENTFGETIDFNNPASVIGVVQIILNIFLTFGLLFWAWKFVSVAIDYFNIDAAHINVRSHERSLFYEFLEPIKGLLILLILGTVLNIVFGVFTDAFGGPNVQFNNPTPYGFINSSIVI